MAGPKLSEDFKREYVEGNMQHVPATSLEKFKTWPLDKQYTQMRIYVNKADTTPKKVKEVYKMIEGKYLNYDELGVLIEKLKEKQDQVLQPMIKQYEEKVLADNAKLEELRNKLNKK